MTDRHTASSITDAALTDLYDQRDQARTDLEEARERAAYAADMAIRTCKNHDRLRTEAETARNQYAELLREAANLLALTHRYGSLGGHDNLGENWACAGCGLADRIRTTLNNTEEPR